MTDYQTATRMALKEKAIPLPDLAGKTVLDVGCDHGHWCWLAAERGAKEVFGLDRGRKVNGIITNLAKRNVTIAAERQLPCFFDQIDLGRQWKQYGAFDVVFCFSMYHHVYENCRDHEAIWHWLWRHTYGELLWENPTGIEDPVVRMNVKHRYVREEILAAAERYFDVELIGPAMHVPTREVWRCKPLPLVPIRRRGTVSSGAGGAAPAFEYAGGRRIEEIERALGVRCVPGSLNVRLDQPFSWDTRYFRTLILDVKDRKAGLDSEWQPRWARFYPVTIGSQDVFVFRFEGENYDEAFVELIADRRLRDIVTARIEFHA
jgi:SAM-dependent methyltransferase